MRSSSRANPVAGLPPSARARLKKRPMPRWLEPMLATLTDERFSDPAWIFETKFDGERCLVFRTGDTVRLMSRNQLVLNAHYPEIADAFRRQSAGDFIVDGEVVAFEGRRTSFEKLQHRMQIGDPEAARRTNIVVYIYVFDVPYAAGYDLTGLALRHRKAVLRRLLRFGRHVRFTTHRDGAGVAAWRSACARGLEGVIAKNGDSTYQHRRSRDWLKFKCVLEQEFVIGGFTDPRRSRVGFGALLLGYYEGGKLVYAGKVGTGFDRETLETLRARLGAIERESSAYGSGEPSSRGVHWVKPELVAQVGFTEWTRSGELRHPRFLGLREDKSARAVRRERPLP